MIHRNLLLPVALPYERTERPVQTGPAPKAERNNVRLEESDDDESCDLQFNFELDDQFNFELDDALGVGEDRLSDPLIGVVDVDNGNEPMAPIATSPPVGEDRLSDPLIGVVDVDNGNEPMAPIATSPPPHRRPQRTRRPPDRYGDYVYSRQQTGFSDTGWRDKVSVLISLLNLFPTRQAELFDAIVRVISPH
jgi:hypothetical protein